MEIADKWFAIVNPVAGSGRGLTDWPLISRLLRERHIVPEYVFTERKYHAIELAVEAVNNGFRKIIVVGGDGTIHEVVNGLFIQKTVPTTDVLLSVIAVGHSFLQDVGVISYYKASYKQSRYMANVAGVGFDAFVNRKYNHLKEEGKKGKWLYLWSTLKAVLRYSSTGVKVYGDDELVVNDLVYSATIGIGRYNGGGMLQTPEAVADDGLFDLTVIRKMSRLAVLLHFKVLFNGRIYKLRKTSLNRGRRIRIESSPEIAVEVDGEALGYSPFEFEIIDRAVRVVVAERFLSESAGASSGSPAPETNRPSTN